MKGKHLVDLLGSGATDCGRKRAIIAAGGAAGAWITRGRPRELIRRIVVDQRANEPLVSSYPSLRNITHDENHHYQRCNRRNHVGGGGGYSVF